MSIPRTIGLLSGFVVIKSCGSLPYETEQDREELEVLGKIYAEGVQKGVIILHPGMIPQIEALQEKSPFARMSGNKLMQHCQKNMNLLAHFKKEIIFLDGLMKKSKRDVFAIKIDKLKKII